MQVQNVRVFVYFPMLSGRNVSALVTWDALTAMQGGGFVQNYTVQVFQNGQLLPEVSPTHVASDHPIWVKLYDATKSSTELCRIVVQAMKYWELLTLINY